MPKVSIIIPTYNRAWSILRCLKSVAQQSFQDFECHIIDDGSTDETQQLVSDFIHQLNLSQPHNSPLSPQFTYIKTTNQGVSAARNFGVKNSHSDSTFIAFLDSDDEWHQMKLQSQIEYHQNHSMRISQTQEIWIREGVRVNAPKHFQKLEGEQFFANLKNCMISPSSVFMERSLFEEFDGFDSEFTACEDYDLWIQISAKYPIGLIREEYLTRYGGHEDQLSAKVPILDTFRMNAIVKLLKSNILTNEQRDESLKILHKKYKIVKKGAQKRQNEEVLDKISHIGEFLESLAY